MKILIFNPHHRKPGGIFFPLGLGYVAASLKNAGHDIKILDGDVNEMSKEESLGAIISAANDCDILATGGLTNSFSFFEWLVPRIKALAPDLKVVIGNSVVGSAPELFIENVPADFGVTGEGENTVVELANVLENGGDYHDVRGIVFKDDGDTTTTPPAEPLKNLDEAPWPAWDFWPTIREYVRRPFYGSGLRRKMNMCSSRSCPYKCGFCFDILKQHAYRWHSAERVVEEIKFLKKNYRVSFISFSDACFVINRDRVFELCDLMIKEKLNIRWACDGRANLADEELYRRMHEAGARWIDHGFESGSNLILKNINKMATAEEADEAIRICRKVGIIPSGTFMAGFRGETAATIKETIEFRKRIDVEFCPTFFATAYPSTPLWEWCVTNGRIKDPLAYIRSLGEMLNRPYVNCTDFSDEELVGLRNEMDAEVKKEYVKKHPLWPSKTFIRRAYNYYRYYGARGLARKTLNTTAHK